MKYVKDTAGGSVSMTVDQIRDIVLERSVSALSAPLPDVSALTIALYQLMKQDPRFNELNGLDFLYDGIVFGMTYQALMEKSGARYVDETPV